jgi:hypothetical protein
MAKFKVGDEVVFKSVTGHVQGVVSEVGIKREYLGKIRPGIRISLPDASTWFVPSKDFWRCYKV